MSIDAPPIAEADLFAEVLSAGEATLNLDLARWLLTLRFTPTQQARVQFLADRANAGTLTDEERIESENYRRVGNLLSLLQSKARLALQHASRSN
jgi:hypothetical protein